jgi:hypothetical protein
MNTYRLILIEWTGVAVRLLAHTREVLGLNIGWSNGYADWGLSKSLEGNVAIISPLGHYRFLPNPFQIHHSCINLPFDSEECSY